jgi:hypothetical protein
MNMIKRQLAVIVLFFLVAFAGVAQETSKYETPKAVFNIPYEFYATGASFPAGIYEIRPNAEGTHIELRNVKGELVTIVTAATSLSPRKLDRAQVGFDVVGQDHYLSEFYMPGVDGLSLPGAATVKHKHEIIQAQR